MDERDTGSESDPRTSRSDTEKVGESGGGGRNETRGTSLVTRGRNGDVCIRYEREVLVETILRNESV